MNYKIRFNSLPPTVWEKICAFFAKMFKAKKTHSHTDVPPPVGYVVGPCHTAVPPAIDETCGGKVWYGTPPNDYFKDGPAVEIQRGRTEWWNE